jgi:thiol-disulfide isomerase/thioredoxin
MTQHRNPATAVPAALAALLLATVLPAAGQSSIQRPSLQRPALQHSTLQRPSLQGAAATPTLRNAAADPANAEPDAGLVELFGRDLRTDKGHKANLAELNGKVIAVYFSASWCPPCRAFSPRLVELADKLHADGKPFAIVLVGCDRDERAALAYMKDHKMTGYLIPPGSDAKAALAKRYGVSAIPYLVIVDSSARSLDPNPFGTVQSQPGTAWDKWTSR